MLKARDIMSRNVVTVSEDMEISELGRLFIEERISGAPVIDGEGRLVGIVTENDLIRRNARLHIPTVLRIFDALIPVGSSRVEEEIRRMSASKVSEICTREVVTVTPETPVQDIATIMSERKIHLLPVVSGGKVEGVIGKIDVIKGMVRETDEQRPE